MVLRFRHDINMARVVQEQSLIIKIYSEAAVMLCCQGCGSLEVVGTQGYTQHWTHVSGSLLIHQHLLIIAAQVVRQAPANFAKRAESLTVGEGSSKRVSHSLQRYRAHGAIVAIVAPHAYAFCGSGVW
jgi:hypothetical protein